MIPKGTYATRMNKQLSNFSGIYAVCSPMYSLNWLKGFETTARSLLRMRLI